MSVAKRMPNPSDVAIGMRNWAWMLSSNIMGISPAKVVMDVSMIGRNRLRPAWCTAVWKLTPARRC